MVNRFFVRMMLTVLLAMHYGSAGAGDALLGAGDALKISVFNNPELATETKVSDAGTISFPMLGQVVVGGLTPSAAEKKIAGLLENGGFVKRPQVSIFVSQLYSQQVSVLGHVNKPGRYPIDGKRSLTDLLAMAGGIDPEGDNTVTIIHSLNGRNTKETIDLIEMVHTGNLEKNAILTSGDIVYVERAPHFYIYGEVQRPGTYRLERNMTVLQALSAGGGLTPRGTERGIQIKRHDASGRLRELEARHDDPVNAEDIVYVKESFF